MDYFHIALLLAAFLCALVAGFLFAFAVVAMPGIKNLHDREFILAFRAMDRIIQNNQPLFMVVWVGSIVVLLIATVLGVGTLEGIERGILVVAAIVYVFGVQSTTFVVNIPLNNRLQSIDVDHLDEAEQRTAREAFESRWNRWNRIRTVNASLVAALLMILLLRC